MNKKIFAGVLSLSMLAPTPVLATDNPLSTSQNESLLAASEKFKNEDNSNKAKNKQPFDIQSEAYSLYSSAKSDFISLKENYGNLYEESNASEGFKSYLKSVQEDKDNQALQNDINKVAQANYTVKTTSETMSNLADAVGGVSDEEKASELEAQEQSKKEAVDNVVLSDKNVTFSEAYENDSLEFGNSFSNTRDEQTQKTNENKESNLKEFGSASQNSNETSEKNQQDAQDKANQNKKNNDKINQSLDSQLSQKQDETDSKISQSKDKNSGFGNAAASQNSTIQKNYNILRQQIINSQKAISSASSSASTSKTYQKKVNSIINKIK